MSSDQTPTPTSTRPSTARRNAVIGVGAGLLAGGAIGLMALTPSFTSAATGGSTDTGLVVQQDADTDTSSDDMPDGVEPGQRVRELLQDLVDDGTITSDQADAVATHLAEHRPEHAPGDRGGRGHRGGPGRDGEVVAGLLGIDAETLREELVAGNSIADIAEANGVDVQTVIDALVDEAAGHLDLAVEDGRLTDDEAAEKLADVTERITARVNGEGRLGRR